MIKISNYSGLFANCIALYDGTVSGTTLKNLITPGTYDGIVSPSGITTGVNNKFGIPKAYTFTGGTGYYNLRSDLRKLVNNASGNTFIVVFKCSNPISYNTLIGSNNEAYGELFLIYGTSGGYISIYQRDNNSNGIYTNTSSNLFSLTDWNFLAVTRGSGANFPIVFYLNGTKTSTTNTNRVAGNANATNSLNLYLGHDDYNNTCTSTIAYVGFWNSILSDAEVAAISKLLLAKPIQNPHNLRSWWA